MAPEVEFDSRYGVKADVFSLGVVLHVMLTGRFPITALNEPAQIHESIPGGEGGKEELEDSGGGGLRELLLAMLHGNAYKVGR